MSKMGFAAGISVLAALGVAYPLSLSQNQSGRRGGGQNPGRSREYPLPTQMWQEGSILLGCPTSTSVDLSINLTDDAQGWIEFGPEGEGFVSKTSKFSLRKGEPFQTKIEELKANSAYHYRLLIQKSGSSEVITSPEHRIQTQRAKGSTFSFMVQGDSHPERTPKMHVPSLYERTLLTASSLKPDFFICMGDDFSVDTLKERTKEAVDGAYRKQVPYLGLVAHSSPLFLVNGNHEQAAKVNLDGTPSSLGVLAQTARNRFFVQPAPDGFYTGNSQPVQHIGLLRNYYAWTWGDALFVVIDPYWHSDSAVDNSLGRGPSSEGGGKRNRNLWDITLGDAQYRWLSKTLFESRAHHKFVFAHHVHGTGRGGVEQAPFYEWGGKDRNGTEVFKSKRPGWDLPIHQLFVKSGVDIFFQGHDHIFCKQELDGVIYQSCPCPADPTNSLINGDAYQTGDKEPGAGLIRVTVDSAQAKVDYLRAYEPKAETEGHKHGEISYSYTITSESRK